MIKHMTRSEIVFELDGRTATVQGEALVPEPGQPSFIIYADSITGWDTGTGVASMTPEDRQRFLEGVMEALRARGTPFEIEGNAGLTQHHLASVPNRVLAGERCPQTGHWFTPANLGSGRRFVAGEVMPDFGGDYGATIWQWDEQQ